MIEHEVEPYSVLEVQQLIEAAKRERNGVRWVVALVLCLRQGRPSVSNGMTSTG
jgi:integrase